MVHASLAAASIAALVAGIMAIAGTRDPCPPSKRDFRKVSAFVWLALACMWIVAIYGDYYIIRSGILTRLLIVLQAVIYIGEIWLERRR